MDVFVGTEPFNGFVFVAVVFGRLSDDQSLKSRWNVSEVHFDFKTNLHIMSAKTIGVLDGLDQSP
jgi:hypothetical protein